MQETPEAQSHPQEHQTNNAPAFTEDRRDPNRKDRRESVRYGRRYGRRSDRRMSDEIEPEQ